MNVTKMVELNNKLRGQLNPENEKYYSEIMVFIRTSNVSQHKAEELLLEILDHLLEAQKNGKTAKDVFGNDPVAYCKELVSTLPKPLLRTNLLTIVCSIIIINSVSMVCESISSLLFDNERIVNIHLSEFIFDSVFGVLSLNLILRFINKTTFKDKAGVSEKVYSFLFILGYIAILTILYLGIRYFLPHEPSLQLSSWFAFGLGAIAILATFLTIKYLIND